MLTSKELQERIKLALDIVESELANEIVDEVMSLSEAELENAVRARGDEPSAVMGRAPSNKFASDGKGSALSRDQTNSEPSCGGCHGEGSLSKVAMTKDRSIEDFIKVVAIKGAALKSEKKLGANSEERLLSLLATLEQCRAVLAESSNRETVQLLSVAILQLRMKLNQVADSELKALCDGIVLDDCERRSTMLKLIK
jgi:hypothetical protein